jgi:hypothetical protein
MIPGEGSICPTGKKLAVKIPSKKKTNPLAICPGGLSFRTRKPAGKYPIANVSRKKINGLDDRGVYGVDCIMYIDPKIHFF